MRRSSTNLSRISRIIKVPNFVSWTAIIVLIYIVLLIKFLNIQNMNGGVLLLLYSIGVSTYLLSRFLFAHFYEVKDDDLDPDYTPTITFGIPSKNEEANIAETIRKITEIDYPKSKYEIIAINDGSTDYTLREMKKAARQAQSEGVSVKVIDWKVNRGKRHGMAECVKMSKKDIMVFIDSDSFIEKNAPRELVKYFKDPKIAATTAHCYVANESQNALTKMQAVRYFVAFKAYKGAESIFGTVTCCSGSCSAYRRVYVNKIVDKWLSQRFLGVTCTYGDDRSLTNALVGAGYDTLYAPSAIVHTVVPDNLRQYLKQQLRWKKSWFRECTRASLFMWKRNIFMSASFYVAFLLPLIAPFVVLKALVWFPGVHHEIPVYYIFGVVLMAVIYGLYYRIYSNDRNWLQAVIMSSAYSILLSWQLVYAVVTIRDSRWGTR